MRISRLFVVALSFVVACSAKAPPDNPSGVYEGLTGQIKAQISTGIDGGAMAMASAATQTVQPPTIVYTSTVTTTGTGTGTMTWVGSIVTTTTTGTAIKTDVQTATATKTVSAGGVVTATYTGTKTGTLTSGAIMTATKTATGTASWTGTYRGTGTATGTKSASGILTGIVTLSGTLSITAVGTKTNTGTKSVTGTAVGTGSSTVTQTYTAAPTTTTTSTLTTTGTNTALVTRTGIATTTSTTTVTNPCYGTWAFCDNFETGNGSGWNVQQGPIQNFAVVGDGSKVYRENDPTASQVYISRAQVGMAWLDSTVEASLKPLNFSSSTATVSLWGRYDATYNADCGYYVSLRGDGKVALGKRMASVNTALGSPVAVPGGISTGTWYSVKLDMQGTTLKAYVNGSQLLTQTDSSCTSGSVGVGSVGASFESDDVRVTAPTTNACVQNWRDQNNQCGAFCRGQTQNDRLGCGAYLDCYANNGCSPETCGGDDDVCGVHHLNPWGNASKEVADQVYKCLGCAGSVNCANPKYYNGTVCADGSGCTWGDTCQNRACVPDPNRNTQCSAADQCHNAGICDTTSGKCSNPAKPAGTVCRPAAGICDAAEVCDGTDAGCPPDGFIQASMMCRPSTGTCDPAETCSGTSPTCPEDVAIGPPTRPTGVVATPGTQQIALSWSGTPGAKSFTIRRGTASGGPYAIVGTGIGAAYFVNTGLVEGTPYYYVITAVGDCGESGFSVEVSAIPAITNQLENSQAAIMLENRNSGAIPPDLRIAVPGLHTVWIEWDSVAGADNYTVSRMSANNAGWQTFAQVVAVDGQATYDLQDTEAGSPGSTVCYTIDATAAGTSVASSSSVCTVIPSGNEAYIMARSASTVQGGIVSNKTSPGTGDSYVDGQLVAPGDSFWIALDLMPTNAYNVRLTILMGPDRGKFQALIGDRSQGQEVNGYATTEHSAVIDLGLFDNFTALANNLLTIRSTGTDASSYSAGIISVALTPLGVRAEAESAFTTVSSGTESNVSATQASAFGMSQVNFGGAGSVANYKVSVPSSGTYRVLVRYGRGVHMGKWQLSSDPNVGDSSPTVFGLIDGFSGTPDYQVVDLGLVTLTVGLMNEQRNFNVTYIADGPGGTTFHEVSLDYIDLRIVETSCSGQFNSTSCDDGNACTTNDQCNSNFCAGGSPQSCDDHDDCTVDYCDPDSGCKSIYSPTPTSACKLFSTNVTPVLNCVAASSDGNYRAVFGCSNNSGQNISIAPGDLSNRLQRNSQTIYDPIVPGWFPVGEQAGVIIVPFATGETVSWSVGGNVATATGLPTCTIDDVNGTVTKTGGTTFSLPGPQTAAYQAAATQIVNTADGFSSPVGKTDGTFAVTDDGSATYHIPLWVPPGRAGVQPHLSLDYSSGAGNGVMGVGWQLGGFSKIMRCPSDYARDKQRREIRFDPQDKLCLDGQRLVLIAGLYNRKDSEYRTEIDSHVKIVQLGEDDFGPTAFAAYLPDGTREGFGAGLDGLDGATLQGYRVSVTADQNHADVPPQAATGDLVRLGWGLASIQDRYDNVIRFSYSISDPVTTPWGDQAVLDFRPSGVSYNTVSVASGSQANAYIQFDYDDTDTGSRKDIRSSFIYGLPMRMGHLLTGITMFGANPVTPELLKEYHLHYVNEPSRALLDTVKECDGKGTCLTPTQFGWTQSDETYTKKQTNLADTVNFDILQPPYPPRTRFAGVAAKIGDYNGDGLDDLLVGDKLLVSSIDSSRNWGGFGTVGQPQSFTAGNMDNPWDYTFVADLNADGKTDVMWRSFNKNYGQWTRLLFCPGMSQWPSDGSWQPQFDITNPASCPLMNNHVRSGTFDYIVDHLTGNNDPCSDAECLFGQGQPIPYAGDFDGDGLPDLLRAYWPKESASAYWAYVPNSATGFTTTNVTILAPGDYPGGGSRESVVWNMNNYMVDLNGDGKMEYLFWDPSFAGTTSGTLGNARMRAFNGPTSGPLPTTLIKSTPPDSFFGDGANGITYQFADVNGDGLVDAIVVPTKGGDLQVAINTGQDFLPPVPMGLDTKALAGQSLDILSAQLETWPPDAIDPGMRIVDFDLDGRADIVQMGNACRNCLGDDACDTWSPSANDRTHIVLARSQPAEVGNFSFVTSEVVNQSRQPLNLGDANVVNQARPNGETACGGGYGTSVVADVNGDGLPDLVQLEGTQETNTRADGPKLVTPGKLVVYIRNGQKPGLLSSVRDGLGNTTQLTYAPLSDSSAYSPAASCPYPQYCNVRGKWVVKSHTLAYNTPTALTFSHQYMGAREDITGIGWLGMDSHTVTDTSNQNALTNTYDHLTTVNNLYPAGRMPSERDETFHVETGQKIEKVTTHQCLYGQGATADGRVRIYENSCQDNETETETEPGSGATPTVLRKVATVLAYDPAYGYPTSKVIVSGLSDDVSTHEDLVWIPRYENNPDLWLIGLLDSEQLTSIVPASTVGGRQGERTTRSTSYSHDPNTGVVTAKFIEPSSLTGSSYDPHQYRAVVFDRNAHGQIVKTTESSEGATRTTSVTYDPINGVFPSTVTNALGQTTSTIYHPGLGVLLQTTDPNGLVSSFQYDGLGRPRQATSPKGDTTSITYRSSANSPYVVDTAIHDAFDRRSEYYSAQGRKTEVHRTDESGLDFVAQAIGYDSHGRITSLSRPAYPGTAGSQYGTSIGYDALGRPTYQTDGVGYTSWSYLAHCSTRTTRGPAVTSGGTVDQVDFTCLDDNGRVLLREERVGAMPTSPGGAPGSVTHNVAILYVYGPFSLPEDVFDAATLTRKVHAGYDNLGRATTSSDLDRGTWTRVYDGFGQLREEGQAGGPHSTFDYDLLGRKISETTAQGTSTFLWDLAQTGAGKIASTTSADGVTQEFSYNSYGELSAQVQGFDGNSLRIDLSHDSAGRPSGIRYPAVNGTRFSATYNYSQNTGELVSVVDPSGNPMWHADTRNLDFLATSETFGDGYQATRSFEPQRGYLTAQTAAKPSGEVIASIAYTYDNRGYLGTRTNYFSGVTEQFTHDELGRLRDWSDQANAWSLHYEYDDSGNMTSRRWQFAPGVPDSVTTYSPKPGAGPNQLGYEVIDGGPQREYFYDSAGRQTSGPDRVVTFTDFDLPITISQPQAGGQVNWSFKYDANHNRIAKESDHGSETLYFGGLYERRNAITGVSHVLSVPGEGGAIVALVTQDEGGGDARIEYLHGDPIGSPAVVTSSSVGNTSLGFEPFGQRATGTGPTLPGAVPPELTIGFGGHEQEDDLGLVNMGGRLYDQKLARFLTSDPLLNRPELSQSYNPYSYAMNSPFRFVDPTGFEDEELPIPVISASLNGDPVNSDAMRNSPAYDNTPNVPDPNRNLGLGGVGGVPDPGVETPVMGGTIDGAVGSGSTKTSMGSAPAGGDRFPYIGPPGGTWGGDPGHPGLAGPNIVLNSGKGWSDPKDTAGTYRKMVEYGTLLPELGAIFAGRGLLTVLRGLGEEAGGHLVSRHVGKTAAELSARLAAEPGIRAASTFATAVEAETAVSTVLVARASQLSAWVSAGAAGRLVLEAPFAGGQVLVRGAASPTVGAGVRLILQGIGGGAWRILTGFPIP